jgi:hypothetical protein
MAQAMQPQVYLVIRHKGSSHYWGGDETRNSGWTRRIEDAVKFEGRGALKKARKILIQVRHGDSDKDIFLFATSSVVPLPEWLVSRKSRGWDGAR